MVEGSSGGDPGSDPERKPSVSFESAGGRFRFKVELQPGATTIVSWKDLLNQANSVMSSGSGASLTLPQQPQVDPHPLGQPAENESTDSQVQHGSNRFNSVIQKIERLYAGKESSDEEDVPLDNLRDDDEYDTDDSFIDDTELDDYFQVDKSATKHDGYFINRGKLECIEPTIPTSQQLKKRKHDDLEIENKGKTVLSLTEMNSTAQSHGVVMPDIHDEESLPTLNPSLMPTEGSSVQSQSSAIEEAFGKLEKSVAEFRQHSMQVQSPDNSSQAVRRRLPSEIKQKLIEVAKVAQQAYCGEVPKSVINRLMSNVGHLIQLNTLKRNSKASLVLGCPINMSRMVQYEGSYMKLQRWSSCEFDTGDQKCSSYIKLIMDKIS